MTTRENEIRARLDDISCSPWEVKRNERWKYEVSSGDGLIAEADFVREFDAEFIANAPADIDYLLKENQRLREALRSAKEDIEGGYVGFALTTIRQSLQPNETTTR